MDHNFKTSLSLDVSSQYRTLSEELFPALKPVQGPSNDCLWDSAPLGTQTLCVSSILIPEQKYLQDSPYLGLPGSWQLQEDPWWFTL